MGCGGSTPVELADGQTADGELVGGVLGTIAHESLKCSTMYDLMYGVDAHNAAGRSDPMKLMWGGAQVATIEVKAGSTGGANGNAHPKAWSSTVVCKDANGQTVAEMTREILDQTVQHPKRGPQPRARVAHTTVYSVKARHEGQAAAENGMFAWAQLKPKPTEQEPHPAFEAANPGGHKDFGVYQLAKDGVGFEKQPAMVVIRAGTMGLATHLVSDDRSQTLGTLTNGASTITVAQGVDPVLAALLLLEFKMRFRCGDLWIWGAGVGATAGA